MSTGRKRAKPKFSEPVILAVQPQKFTTFSSPAKLVEWEELATKTFGVPASAAKGFTAAARGGAGTCCESGASNDSDVDYLL